MKERRLYRILLALLGLNSLGLGAFVYYRLGTYVYLGVFEGMPVHAWKPWPPAVVVSLLMVTLGLLAYAASARPSRRVLLGASLAFSLLVATAAIGAVYYYEHVDRIIIRTPLTTDAYILQVEAAKDILEGRNPYHVNYMSRLLESLPPDPYTWVYRDPEPPFEASEIIGFVTSYDYLPPAALYYLPAVALGIPPNLWDALISAAGLTLLYRALEREGRLLFAGLLASGMFLFIVPLLGRTGVTGWFVPLVLAIICLDKPVLAGLFLAWSSMYRVYVGFFALYLLLVAWREGYSARRILAWSVLWALLILAPFLVSDPRGMIEAFLIPYKLNLNPLDMGPGISSLGHLGLLAGKEVYTLLVLAVELGGLLLAWRYYYRLKHAVLVFPALAMLLYYRPSYIYYIYFPWLGLAAILTGRIRFLDEPRAIADGDAWRVSLVLLAANLTASTVLVELVPTIELVRYAIPLAIIGLGVIIAAMERHPRPPEWWKAGVLLILGFLIAGAAMEPLSPVYYIAYNVVSIRLAVRDALLAPGTPTPGLEHLRSVVASSGEPILQDIKFLPVPPGPPAYFTPLPTLLSKALALAGLDPVEAIMILALAAAPMIVLAVARREQDRSPLYAVTLLALFSVLTSRPSLHVGEAILLILVALYYAARHPLARGAIAGLMAGTTPAGPYVGAVLSLSSGRRQALAAVAVALLTVVAGAFIMGPRGVLESYTGNPLSLLSSQGLCIPGLLGLGEPSIIAAIPAHLTALGVTVFLARRRLGLPGVALLVGPVLLLPYCSLALASALILVAVWGGLVEARGTRAR